MTVPLKFLVDWDADGVLTGTGEDVSERVDGDIGVTWARGKDQIRQFAPAAAGQCGFVLNNLSRDYSPGNGTSPIGGLVVPGRLMQIQAIDSGWDDFLFVDGSDFEFVDATDFTFLGVPGRVIWTGLTDGIEQRPEAENRDVAFSCLGNLSKLRGKIISTALYQNILTSDFLGHVLDEAGWPADKRIIDAGLTTIVNAWADKQDAFDLVQLIKNTEGPAASVYEDPEGNLVFENQDARNTQIRSTTSQAVFTDTGEITGLRYDPNFNDSIQAAVVSIEERQAQGQSVVWQLGDTLTLGANEVRRLQITSSDPFMNLVLPSAAPGDTVQTLTADATLTAGTFKPRFREETAATAIDWDSTAAEIQTSLESITTIGSGNVTCEGGPISTMPVSVHFVGVFAGLAVTDLIEIVESTLNPVSAPAVIEVTEEHAGDGILSEKQALRPSTALTGGGPFTLDMPAEHPFSVNAAYNVSAATLQAAIRVSGSWGSVLVTGGPLSSGIPFQINMIYSDDLSLATISGTAVTGSVPTTSISVAITTEGGKPDYVLTAGAVTFSYNRTSGAVAQLTATAGPAGATVLGLQTRGQLVSVIRNQQVSFPEDITDIPVGKIARPSILPNISLATARTFVTLFTEQFSFTLPVVSFTVVTSLYDVNNDALYQREISDRITIVEAQTGISEDYYIEQIRQSVIGLLLVTEFGCQQIPLPVRRETIWY